ncbi:Hypothetical protein ABZS17G119_00583 [Kosakonia cowanii]
MIKSVCRWRSRQLISKWCGILLQLVLLCKAPPPFLKGDFCKGEEYTRTQLHK